ncbi:MAG TPA: Bax inhibitor-1 family protein [Burkholderiales bacterium]|jgi:modulator of FtsH protease
MDYDNNVTSLGYGQAGAVERNKVLRNTYMLTALALIPMAIGAVIGSNMSFAFMATSPMVAFFGFMIVTYGLMFAIQANRNSGLGVVLMFVFTAVLGLMMGPLLQMVLHKAGGGMIVAFCALGTAGVFGGMAAIGTAIKRPLNGMAKFLTIGAIVLLIAMVANVFLAIPAFSLMISAMFIMFSSLMILYQLNQIVTNGETNYISATLTLVISIYNIFVSLLSIFGGSNRN